MNTKTTILRTSQRNPDVRTFFCVREYGQLYRSCRSKKIFTNVLQILCLRNASWIPKQQSYELRSEILTYERSFVFVNTATETLLLSYHVMSHAFNQSRAAIVGGVQWVYSWKHQSSWIQSLLPSRTWRFSDASYCYMLTLYRNIWNCVKLTYKWSYVFRRKKNYTQIKFP